MNSLTDRDVIDKIAEACQAGVRVVMIIRGICCIRANVEGYTEGLMIRQIVGRFLEHTRIYAFGTEADTIYLSSADMMTRNTEHRVEIAYPVLDDTCRKLVVQFVNIQLADNTKARELASDGSWKVVEPELGEPTINAQELLLAVAYRRAQGELVDSANSLLSDGIHADLPLENMRKLASLPSMTHPEDILNADSKVEDEAAGDEAVVADESVADTAMPDALANETPAEDEPAEADAKSAAEASDDVAPEVTHVEARIIDESEADDVVEEVAEAEALGSDASTDATNQDPIESTEDGTDATREAKAEDAPKTKAIEPRTPGRLKVAIRLIGMGVRELFTGRISREAKRRGKR
jgi:polyphosphate kinase